MHDALHPGVAVELNTIGEEQPRESTDALRAEQGATAAARGVGTPRWPLPRWIDWAVGFKVVSLSMDAVCLDPGDRRHDAPFNTVVRGLIGQRLRDLRCLTRAATCTGCPETSRCDYAAVFDRRLTATESDGEADEVPPFWLQGLPAGRTLARGAQLSIRLHVTGQAVGVLPYLDVACRNALVHVGMRPSASVVHSTDLRALTHEPIANTLRITARSPLRLRGDMSRSRRDCPAVPWFAQLVRSGVRRLDRLRMAFGEPGDRPYLEMPALGDVEVVSEQGDSMRSWRDTRKGVPLTGLIGKATTMGFGDLTIEELPDTRRRGRPLDTTTSSSDHALWPLATE
ncbi:MAG: hypothetical protein E6J91_16090 [Deltaproteobacteria bacterium]|nr:MAG: hypothetical protein E6J91_16090 [Deltaproteobacteria bacterium]